MRRTPEVHIMNSGEMIYLANGYIIRNIVLSLQDASVNNFRDDELADKNVIVTNNLRNISLLSSSLQI